MAYTRRTMGQRVSPSSGRSGGRLLIALAVAAFAIISFLSSKQYNPITEEDQYIGITKEQEIALGLEAVPQMTQEFGGMEPNTQAQEAIDAVGFHLVDSSIASQADYPFEFTVLADDEIVNAFALPGGPVFITDALLSRLETEGQFAGVLAHEIGHVIARHSAQQLAQAQLTEGLTGALVLATYDPDNPQSATTAQIALVVGQLVNMKFSREHELQSDELGVRIMADAGYDPRSLIEVMRILEEAAGGQAPPEFASTHPNPGNRVAAIQAEIDRLYPNGVPDGLIP